MNLIRIVVQLRFIYWSSKSLKGITMQYSILVGNLGYWYSYGCHLTCTTHTNTVADHVHPLWQCRYPTAATVGHSVVQHHKNCSGTRRGLQIPQIPIQLSNCGMYWTTELKGFPPRWCQIQQDTLTGSCVQARLEPSLMHSYTSMYKACSCMSHECLNLLRSGEFGRHGDTLSSLLRFSGYATTLFAPLQGASSCWGGHCYRGALGLIWWVVRAKHHLIARQKKYQFLHNVALMFLGDRCVCTLPPTVKEETCYHLATAVVSFHNKRGLHSLRHNQNLSQSDTELGCPLQRQHLRVSRLIRSHNRRWHRPHNQYKFHFVWFSFQKDFEQATWLLVRCLFYTFSEPHSLD